MQVGHGKWAMGKWSTRLAIFVVALNAFLVLIRGTGDGLLDAVVGLVTSLVTMSIPVAIVYGLEVLKRFAVASGRASTDERTKNR
jgi:hypothetical protein